MKIKATDILDLTKDSVSDNIAITCGPISIQPVTKNLSGTPVYTLEVSNDNESFICYSKYSTNVDMSKALEIGYDKIPWQYLRLSVTTSVGATGNVRFKIFQGG